jgi:hypothetical protein
MKPALPPCGLYRTTGPIGSIPAGRLIYFHNHGEPGPGMYLPSGWSGNRVKLEARGTLLPSPEDVRWLEPLPPEGFYRVHEAFFCCEKRCRSFEPESLVQLGYNAAGDAIVFVPEIVDGMLAVPEQGSRIDAANFARLKQLKVPVQQRSGEAH